MVININGTVYFKKITILKSVKNISFFLLFFLLLGCSKKTSVELTYYSKLDQIRNKKHQQLEKYLDYVQSVASSIQNDPIMKELFDLKNKFFQEYGSNNKPQDVKHSLYKIRDAIENRYIDKYLNFYDILFINTDGDIIYTVMREDDYHKNIFGKELCGTNLVHHLKDNPTKTFVDFQN